VFQVLNETFPDHTFLMNGLIMGIKVRVSLVIGVESGAGRLLCLSLQTGELSDFSQLVPQSVYIVNFVERILGWAF
jgi:hypothetical protein